MFDWFSRTDADDISDNLRRWGCAIWSLILLLGIFLIGYAIFGLTETTLIWRLVVGGVGVVCIFVCVGFRRILYSIGDLLQFWT